MYTDCPACNRQFRVRARQLSAAWGLVQCGFCGEQFNALERLRDKPLIQQETGAIPVLSGEKSPEPQFDIPEIRPIKNDSLERDNALVREEDDGETEEAGEMSGEAALGMDLPLELREGAVVKPGWLSRLAWITGVLILFIVAAGQLAWFNRDELLNRYPQLTPWAQRVCEYFQCSLIRERDLAAIKLINRDVREHPRFKDALLVNATIQNTSDRTQPYPRVQLALFDTNGKLIAHREFAPREYLDESIDIDQGIRSQQSVHIVLEVTGPTKGAVSFEFRFL